MDTKSLDPDSNYLSDYFDITMERLCWNFFLKLIDFSQFEGELSVLTIWWPKLLWSIYRVRTHLRKRHILRAKLLQVTDYQLKNVLNNYSRINELYLGISKLGSFKKYQLITVVNYQTCLTNRSVKNEYYLFFVGEVSVWARFERTKLFLTNLLLSWHVFMIQF